MHTKCRSWSSWTSEQRWNFTPQYYSNYWKVNTRKCRLCFCPVRNSTRRATIWAQVWNFLYENWSAYVFLFPPCNASMQVQNETFWSNDHSFWLPFYLIINGDSWKTALGTLNTGRYTITPIVLVVSLLAYTRLKTYSLRFSTEKRKVVRISVCTMTSSSILWNFTTWAMFTLIILSLNEAAVLTKLKRISKSYSEMWRCDVKLKFPFLYSEALQFVSWPQHLWLCKRLQVLATVISNLKVSWDGKSRCWT